MSQSAHTPRYRADIDGLRAIAVLPVVFYHYGIAGFSGGFVGVDVFFVISGFLITGLIHAEMEAGRFSIVNFYERRVRRILPALIVLIAVCFVASLVLLFPTDLERFVTSVIGASLFGSNFVFWREAGYFDSGADLKPLLHTWSLGVEEQYYLLFPGLLLLLRKAGRNWLIAIIALLSSLSLAASIWGVSHAPTGTFFLLPSRFWELGLGALLALGAVPPLTNRLLPSIAAIVGLLLVAGSVAILTADTPFPGSAALAPCLGTALVIYAGMGTATPIAAILSLRPIVFVGLLSYSLYLWHWPLYVFGKYGHFDGIGWPSRMALIAASFLLALLSWRFVETPIRNRAVFADRRSLFLVAGGAMFVFIAASVGVLIANGLPQRYPRPIQALLAGDKDFEPNRRHCLTPTLERVADAELCVMGRRHAGNPDFLVWGDSHADAFLPVIDQVARAHGRYGYMAAWTSCPPLFGVQVLGKHHLLCDRDAEAVEALLRTRHISTVILIARWAVYSEGRLMRPESSADLYLSDGKGNVSLARNRGVFAGAFDATIARLIAAHRQVIVLGPVPEVDYIVPDTLAALRYRGITRDIAPSRAQFFARQRFVLLTIGKAQKRFGFGAIYPHTMLCDARRCPVEANGQPLYFDNNHLSTFGAKRLAPLFDSAF
jgi:peptidoglycan/LPS O-acetylase OafA/YrhL